MRRSILAILFALLATGALASDEPGHSSHGSAFDSGMRTRPWDIEGTGKAPFLITCTDREVQKWFNQGNALLHSFWFEEAERSFRWCLKLDPENAMAYWSLARCGFNWFTVGTISADDKNFDRYRAFLKEAVKRKGNVTERERMYIEAWEKAIAERAENQSDVLIANLKQIVAKFPEDIEAKALLALYSIGHEDPAVNQTTIDQVLAVNPMHPGAHHASIHNWDGLKAEPAIKSCEMYGKAAPGIGHALHMPGHIYSKIGMWHEAAIAMDSATRTELRYMNDRLALPFETWNYPHNRNYLCYIQEQLGMAEASIQGARDLLSAPRDPELNSEEGYGVFTEGIGALVRALIKFERWDEIMTPGVIPWNVKSDPFEKFIRAVAETLALNGQGKIEEAKASLKQAKAQFVLIGGMANPDAKANLDVAEGLIALSEGRVAEGQKLLQGAAEIDARMIGGDPPFNSWRMIRLLGDDFRMRGEYLMAIDCYDTALKEEPNDGFTLSGLAQAYFALGNIPKATYYAGRLEYVWSGADPNLRWLEEVRRLNLNPTPIAETPRPERVYRPKDLDKLGPMNWQPFKAPKLDVLDVNGQRVDLSHYAGKNVLLVFFLGDECVHCVGQLKSINDRIADFKAQNAVVLAVCSASPASLKESSTLGDVHLTFLSDKNHASARRFASYDDFEEMELHSTILIDSSGRVRWKRTGGDPFTNIDFLVRELMRINAGKV